MLITPTPSGCLYVCDCHLLVRVEVVMNHPNWDELLKGHRDEIVTMGKLFAAVRGLAKSLRPLVQRIERLEQRLAETSATASLPVEFQQTSPDGRDTSRLHHRGDWRGDVLYSMNHVVTHARRVWRCRSGNMNVLPGTNDCWEPIDESSLPR